MTSERGFTGFFLCTAHLTRSITAGSIFNQIAHDRFQAGRHPAAAPPDFSVHQPSAGQAECGARPAIEFLTQCHPHFEP